MVHSEDFKSSEIQKYSGAGNDFLILNNLDEKYQGNYSNIVCSLINKKEFNKFDGVIFVESSADADFRMNYFNKDGTGNALCGNALRCTTKYLIDNKISVGKLIRLEAVNNIYKCDVINDNIFKIYFPPPVLIKLDFPIAVKYHDVTSKVNVSFVDVGSPHIIIFLSELKPWNIFSLNEIDVVNFGRIIRTHKDLMPDGANVNFLSMAKEKKYHMEIRSYERGVEGETLACGTGALSAAIVSVFTGNLIPPVKLKTKSGQILEVNFSLSGDKIENLSMEGSAVKLK